MKGSGYDQANQTHRPLRQGQRQLHSHQLPQRFRGGGVRAGRQRGIDQRQVRLHDSGRVEECCARLGVDAENASYLLISFEVVLLTHMSEFHSANY